MNVVTMKFVTERRETIRDNAEKEYRPGGDVNQKRSFGAFSCNYSQEH